MCISNGKGTAGELMSARARESAREIDPLIPYLTLRLSQKLTEKERSVFTRICIKEKK